MSTAISALTVYRLPDFLGSVEAVHEHSGSGDGIVTIRLLDDGSPTDILISLNAKHLTFVKPPLPPEPEAGAFVSCGGDGNLLPFFRRWSEGWLKVDGDATDYTTWPEICELSWERWGRMPTRLVAARELTGLVDLARHGLAATHTECRRFGPASEDCTYEPCRDAQALLARYEVTA